MTDLNDLKLDKWQGSFEPQPRSRGWLVAVSAFVLVGLAAGATLKAGTGVIVRLNLRQPSRQTHPGRRTIVPIKRLRPAPLTPAVYMLGSGHRVTP